LEECLSRPNETLTKLNYEKDFELWFPVMAGIATPEQTETATQEQLSLLNYVALEKMKFMRGGL